MATQQYSYSLRCLDCEATGTAQGKHNDNGPNFSIEAVSDGFRQGMHSPNPFTQNFQCDCGGQLAVNSS